MPAFNFSQALTANQLGFDPLTSWQFRQVPLDWAGAVVKLLVRATGVSARLSLFAGSTNIQQRSPVQGGGTAGVTPAELNTPPILFLAAPGDFIGIVIDEVSALTPTVDGQIVVEPA